LRNHGPKPAATGYAKALAGAHRSPDVRPKSCFGAGHGRSNVQVDFPRARGADRLDSGQRFDPGGRLSGWAAAGFMAEVSAAGSTAAALAGGGEAASAAGAAVTAGEGGVGARVAGAVAAGAMPDGAIRGGGWAIRMAMAMTMGRDGVPITRATATATPPPTVEAARAGSIAKSGRSQADEAATSGGGSSTSANRSHERRTASYFVFFAAR
jgi:hypothetical protein